MFGNGMRAVLFVHCKLLIHKRISATVSS